MFSAAVVDNIWVNLTGYFICIKIVQTANMWMEMMEPYLIWMKLFALFDANFPDKAGVFKPSNLENNLKNLTLMEFTLKSFKFTDEEIRQMHLPLILSAMTQKLQVIFFKQKEKKRSIVHFGCGRGCKRKRIISGLNEIFIYI